MTSRSLEEVHLYESPELGLLHLSCPKLQVLILPYSDDTLPRIRMINPHCLNIVEEGGSRFDLEGSSWQNHDYQSGIHFSDSERRINGVDCDEACVVMVVAINGFDEDEDKDDNGDDDSNNFYKNNNFYEDEDLLQQV